MRRLPYLILVLVVVLVIVVAGMFAIRSRAGRVTAVPTDVAGRQGSVNLSTASPQPAATGQPGALRGPITIDARRQQLIGIRLVPVARGLLQQTVRTVGVVRYDETRQADINLKLEGWIRDLYVDYTGQPIQQGQPLVSLYSPDLQTTAHEYLLALKAREQLEASVISDARERADQLVASARQRLARWDLPADEIRALEDKREVPEVVTFRSPVSGFVIDKQALKGLHVTPGQSLYRVADLSVVWVEADIYERELSAVRAGMRATVTVDAYPGERFMMVYYGAGMAVVGLLLIIFSRPSDEPRP